MDYRRSERSGLKVSRLYLGTMMFGCRGNIEHDDRVRMVHGTFDVRIADEHRARIDALVAPGARA
ncbi:MAG TPA: hypothetical protein VL403_10270 [Candidatus Kryptonia bacterium]|nr:hypothetical protein [Candidatus Kryptonia bacterium]